MQMRQRIIKTIVLLTVLTASTTFLVFLAYNQHETYLKGTLLNAPAPAFRTYYTVPNTTETLSTASAPAHNTYRLTPLTDIKELAIFAPRINELVREALVELIQGLADALDAANVTYFMCGGTLIGSYRHHGFIPWDDDVDLCVFSADRERIEDAFNHSKLSEDFVLHTKSRWWKMYSLKKGQTINDPKYPWKYPFVDIFFLKEQKNNSFVMEFPNPIQYPRSDIFPLHRRPFANLKLWAPRDVVACLMNDHVSAFDKLCKTNVWLHNIERQSSRVHSVDCSRLWPYFPFVFRRNSSRTNESSSVITTSVEQLKIGDRVINTIEIEPSAPA